MGQELRELRNEIKDITNEIKDISAAVNQMVPKLNYCVEELKAINTEQGFWRTIFGRHEVHIETARKDLDELHKKVDKVNENERMRLAAESIHAAAEKARVEAKLEARLSGGNGETIKWTFLISSLSFAKTHWKEIVVAISAISAAVGAVWESIRRLHGR